MNTQQHINALVQTITKCNHAYRQGKPQISDLEYDQLIAKLRTLDPNNPWFQHIEPSVVNQGRKTKLPIPMKSLNKVKDISDIQQWGKSLSLLPQTQLVLMPKYDGVSWLHGEYNHCTYSRGGAENEGQDCSQHFTMGKFAEVQHHETFPVQFTYGELVFSRKNWESSMHGRISSSTGEPYRSPRNTVAGFINRDDAPIDITYATFMRYGVDEESLKHWTLFSSMLTDMSTEFDQWLQTEDGPVLPFYETTFGELTEAQCIELFCLWQRHYYIDGIVIYINDLSMWSTIGRQQTTGNPLYAIAYKNPAFTETFETTVNNITWSISKAGALKPVVNIQAVDTGDCTMENPTGYNAKYIFENGIGAGAHITVTRSGGVIPKIINVQTEASSETMMELRQSLHYCPCCGKPTQWNQSKVELVCTNPNCPGIRLAKINHFYTTLAAEQMGEETLTKLFQAGYDTLQRLLDITFEEIVRIPGLGESIANTILTTHTQIRQGVEITKLMHASDCFTGIGQVKAKSIITSLSDDDKFAFLHGYVFMQDNLEDMPQFQALNKTLQAFYRGIHPFYDFIAKNRLKVLPMEEVPHPTGDKYAGMKICFTGIRDKALEATIVAEGGTVVSGVSKHTTHLIVADINSTSSKLQKAKALNIPILTIEAFKQL